MGSRFGRFAIIAVLVLVGLYIALPHVDRLLFSATTPRAVEPRGSLSNIERSTVELFERVSPSVVQVVGRAATLESAPVEGEGVPAQTGTGFVGIRQATSSQMIMWWEALTSLQSASPRVRLRARAVGTAPNYDVAVLLVEGAQALPPPIAIGTSNDLKVGQSVFAIGNPFGLDQSLTTGIISALKRRLPTSGGAESRTSSRPMRRSIRETPAGRCSICGARHWREHRDHFSVRHERRYRLCHTHRHRQPRRS